MVDISPELVGARNSSIVLKTDASKCKVCLTGDVVPDLKDTKTSESFMIYTRDGTLTAQHVAYR